MTVIAAGQKQHMCKRERERARRLYPWFYPFLDPW